jgi:hypothetical protein
MAAIDYIVSEKSDVFMPSHGGNMGHALQVWLYKFNNVRNWKSTLQLRYSHKHWWLLHKYIVNVIIDTHLM